MVNASLCQLTTSETKSTSSEEKVEIVQQSSSGFVFQPGAVLQVPKGQGHRKVGYGDGVPKIEAEEEKIESEDEGPGFFTFKFEPLEFVK